MVEVLAYVAMAVSVLSAIVSLFSLTRQRTELLRRYAEAVASYEKYLRVEFPPSPQAYASAQSIVTELLTDASSAMSLVTGAPVHASFMILGGFEDDAYAIIFAKDSNVRVEGEILARNHYLRENKWLDEVVRGRSNTYISNTSEGSAYPLQSRYKSWLAVRVAETIDGNLKTLGILTFQSPKANAFKDESVVHARSVAGLIASMLIKLLRSNDPSADRPKLTTIA
jgi:hypothetical protein